MRTRTIPFAAALAALALVAAGCGNQASTPAPPSSSITAPHGAERGTSGSSDGQHPPAQGSDSTEPDCTGPDQGTVCTNPNHGAGDDPSENGGAVMPNPNGDGSTVPCEGTICTNPNHGAGTAPDENGGDDGAAPAPEQRDDDPGGNPCTTGGGDSGTYIWSDDTNQWVCQIG
jgi:hypothetical protein